MLLACGLVSGAQLAPHTDALLARLGFSPADIRTLGRGFVVVETLDTPVREEVAFAGVVHIEADSATFIEHFQDIVAFEQGPGIPQIGTFGTPARLDDLTGLTLPAADLAALRKCRPGDCAVTLSARAIRRFEREVDWSSSAASAEANAILRQEILDLVLAYQADGNAALGQYDDAEEPLAVAEQFHALLASRERLPVPVPALFQYLDTYPVGRPAEAVEFFYWAMVDFGLKHTVRVNHVTIYSPPDPVVDGLKYVIAIKQLWASHYFHTTLELRFLIDDVPVGGSGMTLISLTRSRNDGMTGFTGLFLRPIISRRSREGVHRYLAHLKAQMEEPAALGP